MRINVTLYGMLRDKLPPDAKGKGTLDLPDGACVEDVLAALDIQTMVKVSVNDELERDLKRGLADGDNLQLFRPVGGG